MDSLLFSAFVFFALSSNLTPGPNNIMLMNSGASFGFRRTIPHLLGVGLGFPLMVLVAGLGVGTLFERLPILHEIIRWVGVAYMLWMAWHMAQARSLGSEREKGSRPMRFLEAVLFQWVNPKAWTMGIGALSAYTVPDKAFFPQLLVIFLVFLAIGVPSAAVWTGFGKAIGRFLSSERRLRAFNIFMALLLVVSVIPVILEGLR
jgi:threonine/homoserine/homoserine lactone efflux protein